MHNDTKLNTQGQSVKMNYKITGDVKCTWNVCILIFCFNSYPSKVSQSIAFNCILYWRIIKQRERESFPNVLWINKSMSIVVNVSNTPYSCKVDGWCCTLYCIPMVTGSFKVQQNRPHPSETLEIHNKGNSGFLCGPVYLYLNSTLFHFKLLCTLKKHCPILMNTYCASAFLKISIVRVLGELGGGGVSALSCGSEESLILTRQAKLQVF